MTQRENGNEVRVPNVTDADAGNAHWTVEDIARAKAAGLILDIERTNVIIVARPAGTAVATPESAAPAVPDPAIPPIEDLLKTILHWKGEAERLAGEVTKLQARIAHLSGNDGPLAPLAPLVPLIGPSDLELWQQRLGFRKANPRDNSKARGRGRVIPPVVPHGPHGPIGSEPYVDEDGCWELPMDSQEMLDAIRRQLADEETARASNEEMARLAEEHKRKPSA